MDTRTRTPLAQDDVPLAYILQIVWQRKWYIVATALLCGLAAFIVGILTPSRYEASIIVSPVMQGQSGGLSGTISNLASQFGGLASLAGISVGSDTKKWETLAVLESDALTERYIQANNLLPVLFRNRWDPERKQWKTTDRAKIPTLWQANQFFARNVRTVRTDPKTGLVTMTITWLDPKTAAEWANGLVKMTNDYLRDKAIDESARNIAYLNSQALKTDAVGVKAAIYQILETEINKEMLARGSEEYALRVIDPAEPPERRSSPRPKIWAAVAGLGGAFLGVLWVLIAARTSELMGSLDESELEPARRHPT